MKSRLKACITEFLMIITLLMVMFVCICVYGVGWTTTEVVSTESTSGSSYPSLGVGPDGTVHIAWQDKTDYGGSGTDQDIFYKKFVPSTGWTTTEVVSTESTSGSYFPSLDVGSDGTVHIAWDDITNLGVDASDQDVFYKKFVPGTGWTTTEVVSTESTGLSWIPSLAVGPDGAVHIAWSDDTYGTPNTNATVFYKRFEPSTGWTTTEIVSPMETGYSWNPSLGVGPDGTVHIAWNDDTYNFSGSGGDTDVFYRRFVPGSGWTTIEVVSTGTTYTVAGSPSLGVGPDGAAHIAWYDYDIEGFLTEGIFYRKFVPGTGWTTIEAVTTESTGGSSPSLDVDSNGTIHIVWEDYDGITSGWDIFYKKFVPGTGWTTTEVVTTERTEHPPSPSLGVGPDGAAHIAWYDETEYGGSGTDEDIFYIRFDTAPPVVYYDLTVSVMGSGSVSPGVGTHNYEEGTLVPVYAAASPGWALDHYILNSENIGIPFIFVINMTADYTLTAVFREILNPPEASFTYSPLDPEVDEVVTFDASGSSDIDGTIVSYFWDFGDGVNGTGTYATATHSYTDEGTYTVTLTVTDDDGLTDTTTQTIADVIPEFPTWIILPLFMMATLAVVFYRKKLT